MKNRIETADVRHPLNTNEEAVSVVYTAKSPDERVGI